ncbi:MAG: Na+-translocating NADH-quinone reductase subunit C [Rhodospirillaceae bacterium]|nr:Na+-translocating NADH-quinone reductase subunit C [Rhodospirillaceae bacterium]
MNKKEHNNLKTLAVAFLVALVCSVIVSLSAVTLKPLQDANRLGEKSQALLDMVSALGIDIPKIQLVERTSGKTVQRDNATTSTLEPEHDIAGLGQIEDVLTVYELFNDSGIEMVILPVRGAGYKSTLKGYLALKGDLNTIAALTFHQHDETPGMGALIMEKQWQELWVGKHIADEQGTIRIEVVKGAASTDENKMFEVDGISGATRTGKGVSNLVRFWLGPDGYGPYIQRLKSGDKS